MKSTIIIFIILINNISFGQKLPRKTGAVEIKKVHHHYKRNKDYELTKKTTNKLNRPHVFYYFDTSGNLIEQVGYGKHHNSDLRILDYVIINNFKGTRMIETITYHTDYEKNLKPKYKTKYYYNNQDKLIKETELDYETDNLIRQVDFEYDSFGNQLKEIFSPTYYYQSTFDKDSKIISFQQIYDSKIRWGWKYSYIDSIRIGNFQTFYNDGRDYSMQEIKTYNKGKLSQKEEKYVNKEGLAEIKRYYYNKAGILSKIESYKAYNSDKNYQLEYYTDVKLKLKLRLKNHLVEKINLAILEE